MSIPRAGLCTRCFQMFRIVYVSLASFNPRSGHFCCYQDFYVDCKVSLFCIAIRCHTKNINVISIVIIRVIVLILLFCLKCLWLHENTFWDFVWKLVLLVVHWFREFIKADSYFSLLPWSYETWTLLNSELCLWLAQKSKGRPKIVLIALKFVKIWKYKSAFSLFTLKCASS